MLDRHTKGFWHEPVSEEDFLAAQPSLFGGAFSWPVLALRRTAVECNIATMRDFCAEHGFEFAPHGKTTMAPKLFQAQLDAGAWGITVATPQQAFVCRSFGVPRVLLANQVLDSAALQWLADEADAGFECLSYVDSPEGVAAMAATTGSTPLPVLVELGFRGGRTGCRTFGQIKAVVAAAKASPRLRLVGVAGYEGGLPDRGVVSDYLYLLRGVVNTLCKDHVFHDQGEVIISVGGSAWFDLVAKQFGDRWVPGVPARVILRSGATLTHDHGFYREKTPFNRIPGELSAGLELWAQVLSTPEDDLAIVNFGRRDASFDEGLPVPLLIRDADGRTRPAGDCTVTRLNDQHAYVQTGQQLSPGELVCFGISHPCTTLDKWRVIPVIEDDHTVSDLLHTYF